MNELFEYIKYRLKMKETYQSKHVSADGGVTIRIFYGFREDTDNDCNLHCFPVSGVDRGY